MYFPFIHQVHAYTWRHVQVLTKSLKINSWLAICLRFSPSALLNLGKERNSVIIKTEFHACQREGLLVTVSTGLAYITKAVTHNTWPATTSSQDTFTYQFNKIHCTYTINTSMTSYMKLRAHVYNILITRNCITPQQHTLNHPLHVHLNFTSCNNIKLIATRHDNARTCYSSRFSCC